MSYFKHSAYFPPLQLSLRLWKTLKKSFKKVGSSFENFSLSLPSENK